MTLIMDGEVDIVTPAPDGEPPPSESSEIQLLGHIIGLVRDLNGNPDRDLVQIQMLSGREEWFPISMACPCIEALLELVGRHIVHMPLNARAVHTYCFSEEFQLCPRFPSLCTRPGHVTRLHRYLESHPEGRKLLLDIAVTELP